MRVLSEANAAHFSLCFVVGKALFGHERRKLFARLIVIDRAFHHAKRPEDRAQGKGEGGSRTRPTSPPPCAKTDSQSNG
jgi:hypothetical protein